MIMVEAVGIGEGGRVEGLGGGRKRMFLNSLLVAQSSISHVEH